MSEKVIEILGFKKELFLFILMFCPLEMNVSILFSRKKTPTPIPSIHQGDPTETLY